MVVDGRRLTKKIGVVVVLSVKVKQGRWWLGEAAKAVMVYEDGSGYGNGGGLMVSFIFSGGDGEGR